MPYTLNLGFAGMCLFVPELSSGAPDTMHVLLPNTAGHSMGPDGDEHFAAFVYDPACETENNAAPGGVVKNPEVIDIAHTLLDLTKLSASGTKVLEVPPGAANFGDIVTHKVAKRHFSGVTPGEHVLARISFKKGEATVPKDAMGGVWNVGGKSRQLPIRVVYTIKMDDDHLDLTFEGLNKHPKKRPLKLFPDKDKVLTVWIFHSPADQLPTELPPPVSKTSTIKIGDENPHFSAYYDIVRPDVPVLEAFPALLRKKSVAAEAEAAEAAADDDLAAAAAAGSEVTCVIALAEAQK